MGYETLNSWKLKMQTQTKYISNDQTKGKNKLTSYYCYMTITI